MSRPADPAPPSIQKQSLKKSTVRCSFCVSKSFMFDYK